MSGRTEITPEEVRAFKRLWYRALITGETQRLHLHKGRKVEDIKSDTAPEAVGITDSEQVEDIVKFKRLIGQVRLIGVMNEKEYEYLDSHAISTLAKFRETLDATIDFIFPPIHDARLSMYSPVIFTRVLFNKEKVNEWLANAAVYVEEQIGSLDLH